MHSRSLVGKWSALGSTACAAIGSLKSIGLAAFMKSLFPQLGIRIYLPFFPGRASSRQPAAGSRVLSSADTVQNTWVARQVFFEPRVAVLHPDSWAWRVP